MKQYREFVTTAIALGVMGVITGCGAYAGGTSQSANIVDTSSNNSATQMKNTTAQSNGNVVNNSSASGTTQSRDFPSNSKSSYLLNIEMLNSQDGYVSGYFKGQFSIWKTLDGGTRWIRISVPQAPTLDKQSPTPTVASFVSTSTGWIAWISKDKKNNVLNVLDTNDGGRTFTLRSNNVIPVANYVRQIHFSSAKDGWIQAFSGGVMNQGDTTIYHTDDGGKTWTMVSSAGGYVPNKNVTPHALPELDVPMPMTFTNAQDGWVAVGNVVVSKTMASLYYTHTAGTAWKAAHLPIPQGYESGFETIEYKPVFTGNTGTELVQYYKGGTNNQLVSYRTANTGRSWAIGTNISLSQNDDRVRQSFLNAQDGWIIGSSGTPFEQTTNGGKSWTTIQAAGSLKPLLQQGFDVKQLNMVTSKTGWVLLNKENSINGHIQTKILKTTDGGNDWVVQTNSH
ncbi:WD40/YVTN/BNR-like repeat-containing protein [Alicyclobacillus mengziensis]|uniref:Photosynthesis system II assembly factor Ycf48/Hcf136-like domain-containing protein n=1 Tax=Alicyclobacillus mengziensis TaxID=2931921 RepID=A0A9X7Z6W9_9BACL|nr:hypothetical protein [Alicyclobacillus mengziensis]QSO46715.1 hypothetical protein JZ786_20090 [Alicyclobacillus mengziensis]